MMMQQFYFNLSKKLKKKQKTKWLGEEFQTTGKPSKKKLLSFFPYEEQSLMGEMGCKTNTQIDLGKFRVKRTCNSFLQHSTVSLGASWRSPPPPIQHSGKATWHQRNVVPKKYGLQTARQQGRPRCSLLSTLSHRVAQRTQPRVPELPAAEGTC